MDQQEPTETLENNQSVLDDDNIQQYVDIGNNIFVGSKDGIKYTLISMDDNKFQLCEVKTTSDFSFNSSKSSSLCESSIEDTRNSSGLTPTSDCKALMDIIFKLFSQFVTFGDLNTSNTETEKYHKTSLEYLHPRLRRDVQDQGDGAANSFISTPESRFRNVEISIPEIGDLEENVPIEPMQTLTYTTLMPVKTEVEEKEIVPYTAKRDSFYQVIPQVSETPQRRWYHRPIRQKMPNLQDPSFLNYSSVDKMVGVAKRGRGRGRGRGRPPKRTWINYKFPVMHSTPTSAASSSYSTSGNSIGSADTTKSMSLTTSNESQLSFEYPRVPNNTPTSDGSAGGKPKNMDVQLWMPYVNARLEDGYGEMKTKEYHNENERKRRLRIKNACHTMRNLLPCVSEKTDNATVFEKAVNFIHHVREIIGRDYDAEFLQKACMY
ncbi:hypothetical protein JTE90_012288 [Oedothorax gibbosus]|uniref:BHLH domain-containing protein n=1 Tax=Oedothorax gibbosus TaxID=931172 RepID=A0AAV6VIB7_9ARAC|nr:hypothetical protein JTE90_012288 [Oedothorax gibbosus]